MWKKILGAVALSIVLAIITCHPAKVGARSFTNYYPTRRVVLTIKYVDSKTGQEIAPQVKQTNAYTRKLSYWKDNGALKYKGPWYVSATPEQTTSPNLTDKGYGSPSDDVVNPSYRGLPDDDDMELVNYTRYKDYSVTYDHRIVTATAENPGDPAQPLEASRPEGPKWPTGTTKDYLTHSVSRTIQYINKVTQTSLSPQIVQTVDYTRNALVDAVTGKLSNYSDWRSKQPDFTAIDSPKFPAQGYKLPNPITVPKVTPKPTDSDQKITVYYETTKASIDAGDSTIIAGPKATWNPKDNFIGAKDQNGDAVDYKNVVVTGTVDATKLGKYPIKYSYTDENSNKVSKTITVNVIPSKVSIDAKDSTIVAGPDTTWKSADNFTSATDQDGNPIKIEQVNVEGTVDTLTPGDYKITYSYTDQQGNKVSKTITVSVVAGRLTFKEVPEILSFNESKISNRTSETLRTDPNWKMIVEDTRVDKNPWRVTAKLDEPFKNSSGESAAGNILLFRKANQSDQWITNSEETNVFDGTSTKGIDDYNVSWSQDSGPIIQAAPGTVKAGEYKGVIQWSLTDAPV